MYQKKIRKMRKVPTRQCTKRELEKCEKYPQGNVNLLGSLGMQM